MHKVVAIYTGGFHWHAECSCGWKGRDRFYEAEAKGDARNHKTEMEDRY